MADNSDDDVKVSSVVYNLAGPEDHRINFLKSLVIGAIQKEAPLGKTISQGYLHGPGIRYRNFASWAKTHPEFLDKFGTTSGKLATIPSVNLTTVRDGIPADAGQVIDSVEKAEIHEARIHFWILQRLYQYRPDETPVPRPPPFTGLSTYSFDGSDVVVTWADGTTSTFAAADYVEGAQYLYAKYTPAIPAQELPIEEGPLLTLAPEDPAPTFPTDTWVRMPDHTAGVFEADLVAQDVVDTTYSDARPPDHYEYPPLTTAASNPTSYVHYISDAVGGVDEDGAKYSIRTHKEFWKTWEVGTQTETVTDTFTLDGGVIQTVTVTRLDDYLKEVRQVRVSTQKIVLKTLLAPRWYIYRYETGNEVLDGAMDAAAAVDPSESEFFYPPIPFRYQNKNIGPLKQIATRWLVNFGVDLGWDDDSYDNGFDIQVAETSTSEEFTSLNFISHRSDLGPGYYYVEGRNNSPLYRVFKDATSSRPGVFKLRSFSEGSGTWTDTGDPEPLLSVPEPSDYGVDADLAELYPVVKKAFKKAYGSKFDDVLESILDNDNIGDIDYAYAIFGVSLNVQENACKKYIYQFLLRLREIGGEGESDTWMENYQLAHDSHVAWETWRTSQVDGEGNPIPISEYGDPDGNYVAPPGEPERFGYPQIDWKVLTVESDHPGVSSYKTQIHWAFIDQNTGHGVLTKPDSTPAKTGELFFKVEENPIEVTDRTPDDYNKLNNRISLNWQVTDNTWRQLVITGMRHENHVYQKYTITYTAQESVDWPDRESPFIFPLHEGVLREMSLVDATQMATACTFLMFNCYQEVETPWYASTWFRVIMIVVVVVLSIAAAFITEGGSLAAGGAVVESLLVSAGAGSTLALLAGVAADIVAGMALSYLVTFLSTALFGEKVGSIVGAIFSLALGGFVAGGFNPQELTRLFTTAPGLVSLGTALTNGAGSYMQYQAQETMKATEEMMKKINKEIARIQKLYDEEFSKNRIDPEAVNRYISEVLEKPEDFLARTLMTGSDIVEETLRQIDNFADDRLQLELP